MKTLRNIAWISAVSFVFALSAPSSAYGEEVPASASNPAPEPELRRFTVAGGVTYHSRTFAASTGPDFYIGPSLWAEYLPLHFIGARVGLAYDIGMYPVSTRVSGPEGYLGIPIYFPPGRTIDRSNYYFMPLIGANYYGIAESASAVAEKSAFQFRYGVRFGINLLTHLEILLGVDSYSDVSWALPGGWSGTYSLQLAFP